MVWTVQCVLSVPIRRHGSDVYLGMCPIKIATPNVLVHFSKTSQTVAAKNN